MATAQRALTGIQLGKETGGGGTLVPATSILTGLTVARHKLMETTVQPMELRGLMAANYRSVRVGEMGQFHWEGTATYEDLAYICAMAMRGSVAPSADAGTPIAYTRRYAPILTDVDQPDFYSIEMGNNVQYWAYNGCFLRSIQISAAIDGLTTFQADGMAITRVAQAKTAALTQRTTRDMIANNWTLAIDDSGGTLGATVFTGCVLNFTWHYDAFDPFKCMDGTLTRTRVTEHRLAPTLTVTVALDTAFVALLTKHVNQSPLLVRLENIGSQIHATPTTTRRCRIDTALVLRDVAEIGGADSNGTETCQLTFGSQFDATATLLTAVELVSDVVTLP